MGFEGVTIMLKWALIRPCAQALGHRPDEEGRTRNTPYCVVNWTVVLESCKLYKPIVRSHSLLGLPRLCSTTALIFLCVYYTGTEC